jgi:hypothetical protein
MNRTLLTAVELVRRARGRIQQGRIRLFGTSRAHRYIIYSKDNKNCVSVLPWTPNGYARRSDSDAGAVAPVSRSEYRLGTMISWLAGATQLCSWFLRLHGTFQQHGDPVPSPSDGWNRRFVSAYQAAPKFGNQVDPPPRGAFRAGRPLEFT